MNKFLTFLLTLISINAFADTTSCSIELFSKIYRLENNQTLSSSEIISSSSCDSVIIAKISQIISNSNGSVGADFLKRELHKEFPETNLDILPRKLSLLELNSVLRDQLTSESNLYFFDSKSLNGLKSLSLVEGEQVKATCENCMSSGEKNIKIDIANPIKNSLRTLWFSSKVLTKINVFKAKRTLSFQEKHLNKDDFYADEIYVLNPDNVLTSLENIHFFKPNKTIIQGTSIFNTDLQATNLVNYGTPVNVTMKNQNISLQKMAMPSRSALFGDIIELKNPNNNKIISGRVIDYNKVVIEL